jgi:hypothetical protein
MKDHHRALRARQARPCTRRSPALEPGARRLQVTVTVPATVTVTVAVPAAAWACGPVTALAVAVTVVAACCTLVMLVRLVVASEDRLARFARMISMLCAHPGGRPPDAPGCEAHDPRPPQPGGCGPRAAENPSSVRGPARPPSLQFVETGPVRQVCGSARSRSSS